MDILKKILLYIKKRVVEFLLSKEVRELIRKEIDFLFKTLENSMSSKEAIERSEDKLKTYSDKSKVAKTYIKLLKQEKGV